MTWVSSTKERLRSVFRREAEEHELNEELSFHLEMESEANLRRGMSAGEARRRARIDFGGVDAAKEGVRDVNGIGALESLMTDARFTRRLLAKSPAFSVAVALTLAVGIGANTAIFSAVDGIVMRPFPFPEPATLVGVGPAYPAQGQDLGYREVLSPAEISDIAAGVPGLERVVAWDLGNRQVTIGDDTENMASAFWFGDAFPTLGVTPVIGRGFLPDEIARGDRVAVVSHRAWLSRLGGDPAAIGQTIRVNGEPFTVIGVMPPGTLIYGRDLWLPMPVGPEAFPRTARQFQLLARLAPGATVDTVNRELELLARRVEAEHGDEFAEYQGWRLEAATWNDINVGFVRPAAVVLMGAVGFVLLLACSNVATLLLARGTGRRSELAVRTALGATRRRILRQVLTENLLLGLIGGIAGIGMAWLAIEFISRFIGGLPVPVPGGVAMNARVLLFALGTTIATGLLVGVLPSLQAVRGGLSGTLRAMAGTTASGRRLRLQRWLVGLQVALAFTLLAGCGLFVNSFITLQAVDPGFATENLLTMRLSLAPERYPEDRIAPFLAELERKVGELPGVSAVATANQLPPSVFGTTDLSIEGFEPTGEAGIPTAYATIASPSYFRTMQLRLLAGRTFDESDRSGGRLVGVVNEAVVDRYFGGADPVGKQLRIGGPEGQPAEIIGVVGSTRNLGLAADPEPEIFASSEQLGRIDNQYFLVIRTLGEPEALLPAVRQAIRELDPEQPVYMITTMQGAFATQEAPRNASMILLTVLAAFALLLAVVGIAGVVSYAADQRRKEIGIRLALGADAGGVRRLIAGQALVPVAVGGLVGLIGFLLLSRPLTSLLYGVSGRDPVTMLGVATLLTLVAWAASYLPALRASRADPIESLRGEVAG